MIFPRKGLRAVLTLVRRLARVLPHMHHQVLFSRKNFRAVAARVLPIIAQENLIKAACTRPTRSEIKKKGKKKKKGQLNSCSGGFVFPGM